MSQQDVDRWRRTIEAFLRASRGHDWQPWLERMDEVLDPEIEWDASDMAVPDLTGAFHGLEEVRRWWGRWLDAWETVEFEYELVDAGDAVVMLVDQSMRGRSTGIEVPLGRYAHFARFENGRMTYWKSYATQQAALRAASLPADR